MDSNRVSRKSQSYQNKDDNGIDIVDEFQFEKEESIYKKDGNTFESQSEILNQSPAMMPISNPKSMESSDNKYLDQANFNNDEIEDSVV